MRVALCHYCWTWGFPKGVHCSECKAVLALEEPDPSAAELGARLGTVTVRLAGVVWERPKLPSRGELWGTTLGLLYWPALLHQPNGSIVPVEVPARTASAWSMLSLWRRADTATASASSLDEIATLPQDGVALGESFLNAPGAAFFPREQVVKLTCRARTWTLHRTTGRALRLTVQPSLSVGMDSWKSFFLQDTWRTIAHVS